MTFAERLKVLRKKRGISQADLANLIDVHFTQVSRYERGETKPNVKAITSLANALDTTVDYLMNGTSNDSLEDTGLDKEIITRFKQIQELSTEEKKTVFSLLDAFIAKSKIEGILNT